MRFHKRVFEIFRSTGGPLWTFGIWLMVANSIANAQSQWPDQRRVGSILVHANFQLDQYGYQLKEIEELQREIPQRLGLSTAQGPIHVYLFSDQRVYEKYLRQYFPGVPYRRALFIKERGPGMVFAYLSSELAVDMRHESTHAVLHSFLPMVPLWLDEGLAEYFEVAAEERRLHNPHLRSVRWRVRLRQVPNLRHLEDLSEFSDMKRDDYRDAWAWTHFLLHGPPAAQAELKSYVTDVQNHVPPGRLSDRLQRRIPQLNREFLKHFQSMDP